MKNILGIKTSPGQINLGYKRNNINFFWEPEQVNHLLFVGYAGSGKTNIENILINYCLEHSDSWQFISLCYGQHDSEVERLSSRINDSFKVASSKGAVGYELEELLLEMDYRSLHKKRGKTIQTTKDPRTGKRFKSIIVSIPLIERVEAESTVHFKSNLLVKIEELIFASEASGIHIVAAGQRVISLLRKESIRKKFAGLFILNPVSPPQESLLFRGLPVQHGNTTSKSYSVTGYYQEEPVVFFPWLAKTIN